MIKGDNIVCGTSSTGTGTLVLAATPVPPGGVDFDVFARAAGFGNSAAVLVSYTIIEYTDNTFAKAHQTEKGIGTLTLGASSGITNASLARTTIQTTATSLDSQPATQNIAPGTGISISASANTLVFIAPSAMDVPAFEPYIQTTIGQANLGAMPMNSLGVSGTLGVAISSTVQCFVPFVWAVPMLAKRMTINVSTAAGTGNSNAWGRLYAIGTDGRPGKLLYDFGLFGTANSSLNATGIIQTGAAGSGFFMTPGEYYAAIHLNYAAGGVDILGAQYGSLLRSGRAGATTGLVPYAQFLSVPANQTGTAADPADLTSFQGGSVTVALFAFSPT